MSLVSDIGVSLCLIYVESNVWGFFHFFHEATSLLETKGLRAFVETLKHTSVAKEIACVLHCCESSRANYSKSQKEICGQRENWKEMPQFHESSSEESNDD